MIRFLRTCFAASTPLRWSVAEDEDACCSNLEADEVRCTNCEDVVDCEDAAAADWDTKEDDAAAVEDAAAIPPDAPLMLLDLCLHRWRLQTNGERDVS